MPMERGQRVQPILANEEATDALDRLAELNPNLSELIDSLGRRILDLPCEGLREQTGAQQRTYNIAFVRPRSPRSRRKAFAAFTAPSFQGTWPPHCPPGALCVGIKFDPDLDIDEIQDPHTLLRTRSLPQQGGGGWRTIYLDEDGSYSDAAFDLVEQAYQSFE